jgi:DNA-binding response OmpR family regulator
MTATILVAEDEASIRDLMVLILTQAGFDVVTASDGKAALDLIKRSRFDLVLLDVHMPLMSGLDVLGAMRRLPYGPRVLMVTANTTADTVREAAALGCSGYIAKPFKPAALVARVQTALGAPPPLILD